MAATETQLIVPVIMCGGAGTRLWPASRETMPKQFIQLIGETSTFQETARRVSDPKVFDKPIIIAGNDVRFIVAEQLQQIGVAARDRSRAVPARFPPPRSRWRRKWWRAARRAPWRSCWRPTTSSPTRPPSWRPA